MSADDTTTAVHPEPQVPGMPRGELYGEGSQEAAPAVPKPECASCHGIDSPTVQEAVKRLRGFLIGDTASSPVATDMLTVLNALEKHHQ